ncbi:Protein phosphatase 2A regulatory B subunit (B56 family) [Musa troglodytarum]|uniref:Protein phosphatase 2A regulatory B subunit (B56 family) n=1 Tax=Musa troglodytarum TaxID=320322 RepID=A0A9E7KV68_9LILI|nr:Protein phosphatase 2A regulatory B subunit (B56 family) [Musa troglodytarum]URE30637.1 Protein phosphatase 2A regulatory B subunit (B56 family) [Musa troglodytarum]
MEMLLNEELEPELGLTGKQILLPDCLLQPIEIKPSEKAGPSPGCFGPLSRVWGRAGKFGFLVELGFAVDFVAGAVFFDCSGDGSLTNRDKLHPETVKENGHLCPENGTGIGTYKKLPDFVI